MISLVLNFITILKGVCDVKRSFDGNQSSSRSRNIRNDFFSEFKFKNRIDKSLSQIKPNLETFESVLFLQKFH